MSNTIDNKVVELQFDNGQFEKAVSSTIAALDKLTKALEFKESAKSFQGITDAAQRVNLTGISAGVRDVNWHLLSIVTVATTVMRNLTTMAMQTGEHLTKALTTDGIVAGFNEYQLKMRAIQTMMASTGESIGTVNKYLNELNAYSDKTIYRFSDMTQNIAKFTNAGIKLPIAVAAIKGIANEAALAGASADEASRAMYNFAQALAKGSIQEIDWKSIEFANMATMDFKNQLLATAVAMGTVKKDAKGMYLAVGKNGAGREMKNAASTTAMFTDNLQYQWLTTEVLTKTLGKYTDVTTELGRKATKAAMNVNTLSMMFDTIKEAIGSGWAMSFEHIFGNLIEARELWTNLALAIGGIIGPMDKLRNDMLNFWKWLGGRTSMINSVINIFNALGSVFKTVGDAFMEVFQPNLKSANFGRELYRMTTAFERFTKTLIPSKEGLEDFKSILKGVFSVFSLGGKVLDFVWGLFTSFLGLLFGSNKSVKGFGDGLTDAVVALSNFFTELNKTVDKTKFFQDALSAIQKVFDDAKTSVANFIEEFKPFDSKIDTSKGLLDKLGECFDNVKKSVDNAKNSIKKSGEKIGTTFGTIGNKIKSFFGQFDWKKITNTLISGLGIFLTGGAFYVAIKTVLDFVNAIKKIFKSVNSFGDAVTGVLKSLSGVLQGYQKKLQAQALLRIALAIGVLAVSVYILSKVEPGRLGKSVAALGLLVVFLVGISKQMNKVNPSNMAGAGLGLILMAGALLLMVAVLNQIVKIDSNKVGASLEVLGILVLFVAGMSRSLGSIDKSSMASAGLGILLISGALLVMVQVVKQLGNIDKNKLVQGTAALGVLVLFIAGLGRQLKGADMAGVGFNMLLIAGAVLVLSKAVEQLGKLSLEQIAKGLGAMAGGLAEMILALKLVGKEKKLPSQAAAVLILSGAMVVLAKALKMLGELKWDEIGRGLSAALGSLALIVGSLKILSGGDTIMGALGIAAVASSMIMLAAGLAALGNIPIKVLVVGLIAMGVALGLIVAAGVLAQEASLGLAAIALVITAMALGAVAIGTAIMLVGAGFLAIAAAVNLLGAAIALNGDAIINFFVNMAKKFPEVASYIAQAFGAFMEELGNQRENIQSGLVSIMDAVINALAIELPKAFQLASSYVDMMIGLIKSKAPAFMDTMAFLLLTLMSTIDKYMPQITQKAIDITIKFIDGLSKNMDGIVRSGTNFIVQLVKGIGDNAKKVSDEAAKTVLKFINGLSSAIDNNGYQITAAAQRLLNSFARQIGYAASTVSFAEAGANIVAGIVAGINSKIGSLPGPMRTLAKEALGSFNSEAGVNSPAKKFIPSGMAIVEGVVVGLTKGQPMLNTSTKRVANSALGILSTIGDTATAMFEGIPAPVITPILDLDNVRKGAGSIAALMDNKPALLATASVGARFSQNGSTLPAPTVSGAPSVSYQQIINSPKPLSRLELYRQTRNLLRGRS